MNSLTYDFNSCSVRRGEQTLTANTKPEFSFNYDALSYDGNLGRCQFENVTLDLNEDQVAEIEAYIELIAVDPTAQTNLDSQMYLAATDWYVIRKTETGTAIPTEILIKREEARESITEPGA